MNLPSKSALAVIGAGPVGVETAAWAAREQIDFVLLEEGEIGRHLRQWGHIRLFSPFRMNHSSWGPALLAQTSEGRLPEDSAYLTGSEYLERYLLPLARLPRLKQRTLTGTRVVEVGREGMGKREGIGDRTRLRAPFRLLLRRGEEELIHRSRAVIDCSGVYSNPQPLGSGNIPAPGELRAAREAGGHLHYGLIDILGGRREQFRNRRVLLVGGGYSAATSLEAFEALAGIAPKTRLIWVNRRPGPNPYALFEDDPLPCRDDLGRLGNRLASSPPGWLRYLPGTAVERFVAWPGSGADSFRIVLSDHANRHEVEVDEVIANTGCRPDDTLYRQLQVHQCYATAGPMKLAAALLGGSGDCLVQESQGIEVLSNPEPNFFILGSKSYGTGSTFLLSHGFEQIETVMTYLKDVLSKPVHAGTEE